MTRVPVVTAPSLSRSVTGFVTRSLVLFAALLLSFVSPQVTALSTPLQLLREARVLDPRTGRYGSDLVSSSSSSTKTLVVVLPQLGEFDSSEFCEQLTAVLPALETAGVAVRVVGIGGAACARRFSDYVGLPLDMLRVDPDAELHRALGLHAGPDWDVPDWAPDDVVRFLLGTLPGGPPSSPEAERPVARAWLNYLAMCAGIGAPGTLREILRGYVGDVTAPERLREDEVVTVGEPPFVTIGPGVGPVKAGPFAYSQWFADERGYQRPVELATVRLKHMVEVLGNWDDYVDNPTTLDRRGATYLFDNENENMLYEYRHPGVLTYSETMSRPLSFLAPYVGEELAKNPLGLPDKYQGTKPPPAPGRGALKPAGKLMTLLKPVFQWENKLQARLLGATEEDLRSARQQINNTIAAHHVVVYTYGLSPFSSEALRLLEVAGCTDYEEVRLGPEWFLLGKEESAVRAALLEKTGQSSLPHVFVGGRHVGGLFSGTDNDDDDESPGLAALYESGALTDLLVRDVVVT